MSQTEIITLAQVTKKRYEYGFFIYLGEGKEIKMMFWWTQRKNCQYQEFKITVLVGKKMGKIYI